MSDWQGRDAAPDDEREFPDLEPIRGRRLSDSDNRGLPGGAGPSGRHGRHSSGRDSAGRDGGGRDSADQQSAPPWGEQTWPSAQPAPYDQQAPYGQRGQRGGRQYEDQRGPDQYGQDQYAQDQYGQQSRGGGQSSRYADEQYTDGQRGSQQQARQEQPAQSRQRSRRKGSAVAAGKPRASSWDGNDDEVTDDPMEAFSKRWARRGDDTPADARRRRRMWIIGGSAVAAIIIAVGAVLYVKVFRNNATGTVGFGALVTTFLPGEVQNVPNACQSVSQATLSQYLPGGQPSTAAPPLNGGQDSQCTWTLDSVPNYRVIEVDISAFSPSGLASGNGSATNAAIDAFANDLQALENPARNSEEPKATITSMSGLGDASFGATQVYNVNGATIDKATVYARYHNVIVTAVVNGTEHAVSSKGTYGPVAMSTLAAAAQQVATEAVSHLPH